MDGGEGVLTASALPVPDLRMETCMLKGWMVAPDLSILSQISPYLSSSPGHLLPASCLFPAFSSYFPSLLTPPSTLPISPEAGRWDCPGQDTVAGEGE